MIPPTPNKLHLPPDDIRDGGALAKLFDKSWTKPHLAPKA
jgi:hypothetical protein